MAKLENGDSHPSESFVGVLSCRYSCRPQLSAVDYGMARSSTASDMMPAAWMNRGEGPIARETSLEGEGIHR